ncbi:MAG TPA: hypothetical protein VGA37_17375 [Gemmatimonadales bacterium]
MRTQRHPVFRRAIALVTVLILGCQSEPAIPEITLRARDFAFVLPDTVAGGLVRFHFVNDSQEDHHAQFIRLNDGVSRAQFDSVFGAVMQAVPSEGEVAYMRISQIATPAGGPSVTAPGGTMDVTVDIAAGDYVLVCFVPSPDGVPHLAKGMRRWLTVTDPPAASPQPPVAAGRVDMADFAFAQVPTFDSGPVVLEVTNSGQEPHEMVVVRLEGVTLEQVLPMLAGPPPEGVPPGPPPFTFMGGLQGIMPGQRAWVTLDLPPGTYALVCFIPSPANGGQPHVALGMVRAFTVG